MALFPVNDLNKRLDDAHRNLETIRDLMVKQIDLLEEIAEKLSRDN